MDKARKKTDKILKEMEREMGRVYSEDSALQSIRKKYNAYMKDVTERTRMLYNAFVEEKDIDTRATAKKAYQDELRALTVNSKEYQKLVVEFVKALTRANQKALDVANSKMRQIYATNYNEVASECRKVGIKVNGKRR